MAEKTFQHNRPGLEIAPWKAKVLEVIDPFGNRIQFSQDLDAGSGD